MMAGQNELMNRAMQDILQDPEPPSSQFNTEYLGLGKDKLKTG